MRCSALTFCAVVTLIAASCFGQPSLKSRHRVKIDPKKPAPGILYSDILISLQDQVAWQSGRVRCFEKVRMSFLPATPGNVPYNARGGARLAHTVTDEKGKTVNTAIWQAGRLKYPFSVCTCVGNNRPTPLEPGKYTFTWHIEGQPFWKVPITVTKTKPADAFEQPKYYFDGPWDKHAYIYVASANRFTSPSFNIYLRDKKSKPGKWTEARIKVDIKRDGKSVARHGFERIIRFNLRPWWERVELALRLPDGTGRYLKAEQILKKGKYEVFVWINDKLYASYHYESKEDVKLPIAGRQDRKTTKGINLLEGFRDRFYIGRVEDKAKR